MRSLGTFGIRTMLLISVTLGGRSGPNIWRNSLSNVDASEELTGRNTGSSSNLTAKITKDTWHGDGSSSNIYTHALSARSILIG